MKKNEKPSKTTMRVFTAILVSSLSELEDFLDSVPPRSTLYVDIEGDNLGRHGSGVSLITVLIHQLQEIYIIDILRLGPRAFTAAESYSGTTLQDILEDTATTKLVWDVRSEADALWHHYRVHLRGVLDIQLLENASRQTGTDKEYLAERDRAVRDDLATIVEVANVVKRDRSRQDDSPWMPMHNNSNNATVTSPSLSSPSSTATTPSAISQRPLEQDTVLSCTRGVLHLRALRDVYMKRISIAWLAHVRQETARRVAEAESADYEPSSPQSAGAGVEKIRGPWKARIGTVGMAPPGLLGRRASERPASPLPGVVDAVNRERWMNKWEHMSTPAVMPSAAAAAANAVAVEPMPMRAPPILAQQEKVAKKRSGLFQKWKDIAYSRPEIPKRNKHYEVESSSNDWWD